MSDSEILAGIAAVAKEHLGWEGPLESETSLVEVMQLDSIKVLTLVVELENHFRICLDPDAAEEIATVGDLVAAISSRLAE